MPQLKKRTKIGVKAKPTIALGKTLIQDLGLRQIDGVGRREILDKFDARDRPAAAKRLGRLVRDGAFTERLLLNGIAKGVDLHGRGAITITVNIETLRHAKSTQEALIEDLVSRTRQWMCAENSDGSLPPVVLIDVAIAHGVPFDIIGFAMFRTSTDLTNFVREVVQQTEHVHATQTVFFAYSYADRISRKPIS